MVYRYIAVKFPLKANILITHKRVNITIVTAFFVCFCTTLKSFVQFTVVDKTMNNKTFKDVTLSKYATPTFTQLTDNFQVIIILYLPFTISVIFAVLMVVTVKRSNQSMLKETQDQQRRKKENTLTRMLVTVVFFYLVSCIFVGLRLSLRAGLGRAKYYSYGVSMTIFDCIARDILMLNSSINLILYSSTNPTFRKIFVTLLFRKRHQQCIKAASHSIIIQYDEVDNIADDSEYFQTKSGYYTRVVNEVWICRIQENLSNWR